MFLWPNQFDDRLVSSKKSKNFISFIWHKFYDILMMEGWIRDGVSKEWKRGWEEFVSQGNNARLVLPFQSRVHESRGYCWGIFSFCIWIESWNEFHSSLDKTASSCSSWFINLYSWILFRFIILCGSHAKYSPTLFYSLNYLTQYHLF